MFTITDKVGCQYLGELKDDVPHGDGRVKCHFNDTGYEGEWKEGTFNGKGRYFWENGWYEGQFKDSLFEGRGHTFFTRGREVCF